MNSDNPSPSIIHITSEQLSLQKGETTQLTFSHSESGHGLVASDITVTGGTLSNFSTESSWVQLGQDIDGEALDDYSGSSVSLSKDGKIVAVGARGNTNENGASAGHVRVYQLNDQNEWQQLGSDIDGEATNDKLGWSVFCWVTEHVWQLEHLLTDKVMFESINSTIKMSGSN